MMKYNISLFLYSVYSCMVCFLYKLPCNFSFDRLLLVRSFELAKEDSMETEISLFNYVVSL